MEENQQEANDFFEEIKRKKVEKFMAVGFTKEQAELLADELKTTSLGMGIF